MTDLIDRARSWIASDPDPATRTELESVIDSGDIDELISRLDTALEFGTAGIRGEVGAGPGRMNRAVVIRTTYGLARYLHEHEEGSQAGRVVVGFDARPDSREFAEDTAGVIAAAGIPVVYFPKVTPTPLVAYAAKHLSASAAVVVTASHNPPADNGYKVYGPNAALIVSPIDIEIQEAIAVAPGASEIDRIERVFTGSSAFVNPIDESILDCYWEEVAATRSRKTGSALQVVYTPIHGVGGDVVLDLMQRAGHTGVVAVPEQAEPDGSFPTVAFPNPEEPGALDLALDLARAKSADLILANDPDADRLAAVVPNAGEWRPLSGNEIGALLGDYMLRNDPGPEESIVVSSIVSSPMLAAIAASYGARHEPTLTGFKWIVRAGLALEASTGGRFIFGYEEALGYTVGSTVRDKDGISAALLFTDLAADLEDSDRAVIDYLHDLWRAHGLWVSGHTSISKAGPEGVESLRDAVDRLGDDPPEELGGIPVTGVTDYRKGGSERPDWLGEQALIELHIGQMGRLLVRPSGTEPKLKIYVDLREDPGDDLDSQHMALEERAARLGRELSGVLGF
ncbi:MAG TPA: phospho-sugar mutase [Acidimicrobiia bacterium]